MKVIIVGGTSGIGWALSQEIARKYPDAKIAILGRSVDKISPSPHLLTFRHDVHDIDSIPALFFDITGQLGGLDLFIYSSGVLAPEHLDRMVTADDLPMIDVNVTGAVAWLNEAANRFQGAGHGCLMAIGSVAGDRGRMGRPVYCASKAFLHCYMESLRNRLTKHGVSVVTVKPGPVETPMTTGMGHLKKMPVEVAAKKIVAMIGKNGEFYLSPVHRIAFAVMRIIPSWIFRRLRIP